MNPCARIECDRDTFPWMGPYCSLGCAMTAHDATKPLPEERVWKPADKDAPLPSPVDQVWVSTREPVILSGPEIPARSYMPVAMPASKPGGLYAYLGRILGRFLG